MININGLVKLTTEDGINVLNIIFLEPNVLAAFEAWLAGLRSEGVDV